MCVGVHVDLTPGGVGDCYGFIYVMQSYHISPYRSASKQDPSRHTLQVFKCQPVRQRGPLTACGPRAHQRATVASPPLRLVGPTAVNRPNTFFSLVTGRLTYATMLLFNSSY